VSRRAPERVVPPADHPHGQIESVSRFSGNDTSTRQAGIFSAGEREFEKFPALEQRLAALRAHPGGNGVPVEMVATAIDSERCGPLHETTFE
jgi:hypothetical protein